MAIVLRSSLVVRQLVNVARIGTADAKPLLHVRPAASEICVKHFKRYWKPLKAYIKPDFRTSRELQLFHDAMINLNFITALAMKNVLFRRNKMTVADMSALMRVLLVERRFYDARECYEQLEEMQALPEPDVLKTYLQTVAGDNEVEHIERIGQRLTPEQRAAVDYEQCLATARQSNSRQAYFQNITAKLRAVPEKVNYLHNIVQEQDLVEVLAAFPDLYEHVYALAEEFAAHGQLSPMISIWQYQNINNDKSTAARIWRKYFQRNGASIDVKHIIESVNKSRDDSILRTTIAQICDNTDIPAKVYGELYSALIGTLLYKNDSYNALEAYNVALERIKLSDLDEQVVIDLRLKLEAAGQVPPEEKFQNALRLAA